MHQQILHGNLIGDLHVLSGKPKQVQLNDWKCFKYQMSGKLGISLILLRFFFRRANKYFNLQWSEDNTPTARHIKSKQAKYALFSLTLRLGWEGCASDVHHQLFRLSQAQMEKQMNRNVSSSVNMHCKLFTISDLQMEVTYAQNMLSPRKMYRWSEYRSTGIITPWAECHVLT